MYQKQSKYILYIICKNIIRLIKVRIIFPLRVNEFLIAFKFQCQADMAA